MEADLEDLLVKLAALKATATAVRAETPDADTAEIYVQCGKIMLMCDYWDNLTDVALATFP